MNGGKQGARSPGTAASTDVGVDCLGFRPVTLDEICNRLAENAARDGGTP
jgi:calcineurin-like phosphoesterase family protein